MKAVNWLLLTEDKDGKPLALKGVATCENVNDLCKSVSKDETVVAENIEVSSGKLKVYVATNEEFDDSFDEKNLSISNTNKIPLKPNKELVDGNNYILQGPSQPKSAVRSMSTAMLQTQLRRAIESSKKPTGTTTYADLGKAHFDPNSQPDGGQKLFASVDNILGSHVLCLPDGFDDWDSFFEGVPAIHATRDFVEKDVQSWFFKVLEYFMKHVQCEFHFVDTSNTPLHQSTDKPAITVTENIATVSYANVVTVMELKASLKSSPDTYVAMGQVVERCRNIFASQPKRKHVIAAVIGVSNCEICFVDEHFMDEKRTGLLSFGKPHYPGFRAILKLITRSAAEIGFSVPTVPNLFSCAYPNIALQTLLFHSAPRHVTTGHASSPDAKSRDTMVFSAHDPSLVSSINTASSTSSQSGSSSSHVPNCVIKFSSQAAVKNEVDQLKLVQGCEFVPKFIRTQHFESASFLQTSPLGRHLTPIDDVAVICQVLADVCRALVFAWKQSRLVHRDVSYGNIIVHNGSGILIDWHVASISDGTPVNLVKVTGTLLFSSPLLSVDPPHAHSLFDDLVSLYFVLLYVALGHYLPWTANIHFDLADARLSKEAHIQETIESAKMLKSVRADLVDIVSQFRVIISNFMPLFSKANQARNVTGVESLNCADQLITLLTNRSGTGVAPSQPNTHKRKATAINQSKDSQQVIDDPFAQEDGETEAPQAAGDAEEEEEEEAASAKRGRGRGRQKRLKVIEMER